MELFGITLYCTAPHTTNSSHCILSISNLLEALFLRNRLNSAEIHTQKNFLNWPERQVIQLQVLRCEILHNTKFHNTNTWKRADFSSTFTMLQDHLLEFAMTTHLCWETECWLLVPMGKCNLQSQTPFLTKVTQTEDILPLVRAHVLPPPKILSYCVRMFLPHTLVQIHVNTHWLHSHRTLVLCASPDTEAQANVHTLYLILVISY